MQQDGIIIRTAYLEGPPMTYRKLGNACYQSYIPCKNGVNNIKKTIVNQDDQPYQRTKDSKTSKQYEKNKTTLFFPNPKLL